MDDANAERHQLREELEAVEREFWTEWGRTRPRLGFSLGPLRIWHQIGSMFIARVYFLFNTACFIAGVALAFLGGVFASIGVALIVGALFSFGAFVSQVWAVVAQHDRELLDQLAPDPQLEKLRDLGVKRAELFRRWDNSDQASPGKSQSQQ